MWRTVDYHNLTCYIFSKDQVFTQIRIKLIEKKEKYVFHEIAQNLEHDHKNRTLKSTIGKRQTNYFYIFFPCAFYGLKMLIIFLFEPFDIILMTLHIFNVVSWLITVEETTHCFLRLYKRVVTCKNQILCTSYTF